MEHRPSKRLVSLYYVSLQYSRSLPGQSFLSITIKFYNMTIKTNTPFVSDRLVDLVLVHINKYFHCRLASKEKQEDGSNTIFLVVDEKNLPFDWITTLRLLLDAVNFEITFSGRLPISDLTADEKK